MYNTRDIKMGVWALFCMKCGKQTVDDQVFCDDCLEIMAQYPVKPETHVQLPNRPELAARKSAPRKKKLTLKEQNERLKKSLRVLTATLAVTLLAFAVTVSLLIHTAQDRGVKESIGKNYNTVNTDGNGR